jgi:hypothetical protein
MRLVFKFSRGSDDFIMQKVYLLRVEPRQVEQRTLQPPGQKKDGLRFGIFKSFSDPYSFDTDPAFF